MLLRWQRLSGTAIHVDPVYMSKPQKGLLGHLLSVVLALAFLPLVLALVIAFYFISMSLSLSGFGNKGRPGFLSGLASHLLAFYLTGKLFGPRDQIPVRDIRVRDSAGDEYLVRIQGELTAGTVNVGDTIEVSGFNRRGTLIFSRGRNTRIGSDIRVKY